MNPTQDQLNARLNPSAVNIQTPSQGLFRGVGDFGTTVYKDLGNGQAQAISLIGDNGLFKDSADRSPFGNAGGQAQEAINRLKSQYGIDYNSLNQVNLADYTQNQNRKYGSQYDATGFHFNSGSLSDITGPAASLSSSAENNTPNQISPLAQTPNNPVPGVSSTVSSTPNSPSNSYTGSSVVDYLNAGGQASDYNSRAQLAQQMGISNYTGTADQNTQLLGILRNQSQSSGSPIARGNTPFGSISSDAPISLGTNTNGVFSSDALGSGMTTQDVLNKTQSYNDVINNYLKQQADAQANLNNTKATALQGQANIMYGLNGTGGHDANLQGVEQQQFDRQMAFQTVPAEIALQNAQTGLALYKQSPEYIAQQQSLSTAQNLIQQYPDLGITYNPSLSPEQNLQAIQGAVSNSPRFQAMNSVLGTNPITGQPMIINKLGNGIKSTTLSGGSGGSTGGGNTTAPYAPGGTITQLPPGVSSIGSPVMDQTALQLFNGTLAPNEVKGRGLQTDAILSQANKVSLALTGKPYDAAAAQSAYDFRQSSGYQNYIGNAPTAIRNLQGMADDVNILGITGNLGALNWTKVTAIANGLWYGTDQTKINAAKDLLSKYSQSADDIGLLLGTGSGSDAKLAIGSQIFQPNGSIVTTNQLAQNVTNTILSKLGDKYKQAGVTDPTQYLSKDMAEIWNKFSPSSQASQASTQAASVDKNWATSYNYDADIAQAKQAIASGADKSAVRARLFTKYAQVDL